MFKKDFIDKLNLRIKDFKLRFFDSPLRFLTIKGIGINHISNSRLLIGIFAISFYLFWSYYTLSYKLLFFAILLGLLGRALTIFQHKKNDRDIFLDMFVDYVLYAFLLVLVNAVAGSYKVVAYNLFIIPLLYLLAIIKKQEFQTTDWIIKPSAQMTYVKALVYVAFFYHWFIENDTRFIYRSLIFSNYLATFLSLYYFLYIQLRWKKYQRS